MFIIALQHHQDAFLLSCWEKNLCNDNCTHSDLHPKYESYFSGWLRQICKHLGRFKSGSVHPSDYHVIWTKHLHRPTFQTRLSRGETRNLCAKPKVEHVKTFNKENSIVVWSWDRSKTTWNQGNYFTCKWTCVLLILDKSISCSSSNVLFYHTLERVKVWDFSQKPKNSKL